VAVDAPLTRRAPPCSSDPGELLDAATGEAPHAFFGRLLREHPISRIGETGVHLVAAWDLIHQALGRERDFSANLTGLLMRGPDGLPTAFEMPGTGANAVIATADEPHHRIHRALAQPRLQSRRIAALEPRLRRWAVEALVPFVQAGGGDFAPVSEIVPARAVACILGLPDGDVQRFRSWAMMGGDMLAGDVTAATFEKLAAETARMSSYLRHQLEAAPRVSDADAPMLHALAAGVDADTISIEDAIGIAVVMFGAGGESTAGLLGSAVRLLAEAPALADELRANPRLLPRFVEETVRLESPFKFHYRAVRRACELGGAQLQPGDRLMLLWAAANRDPAVFEDPDALRLDRPHPKQHLGFGRGAHFCIGAPLARLEARVLLEELLSRTQHLALRAGSPPVHARSLFVRRLESLPLDAC
jgi:cytochrome P450